MVGGDIWEKELGILGREDRDEFGWCDFTCFNFNLSFKKNDVAVDLATDVVWKVIFNCSISLISFFHSTDNVKN